MEDWNQDISALANPILLLTIPFLIFGNQKLYYEVDICSFNK
jgi:hypothetical protein